MNTHTTQGSHNPLISIIVAIYNKEQLLHRCVDSILAQTYERLEILLVDDGSTDACASICDEYAEQDARVQAIHKPNGGSADARNKGLSSATGEYVTFVDADDYILPEMYDRLLSLIIEHEADVSQVSYYRERDGFREGHAHTGQYATVEGENIIYNFYTESSDRVRFGEPRNISVESHGYRVDYLVWNKLYRRDIIGEARFRPQIRIMDDAAFNFEVLLKCERAVISDLPCYVYDINDAGYTGNINIRYIRNRTESISVFRELVLSLAPALDNYAYLSYVRETSVALCKLLAFVDWRSPEGETLYTELKNRLHESRKDTRYRYVSKSKKALISLELHSPPAIAAAFCKLMLRKS